MLKINTEFRKGILFVRLKGEFNKDSVDIFNKKVTDVIKKTGIINVVYNLKYLNSIDFKGINAILYNYELCKINNGRNYLCGNNVNISSYLKKSRLINYVYEIEDELSAIKLLNLD